MDTFFLAGIPYSQLLDDLRALVRYEIAHPPTAPAATAPPQPAALLTIAQAAARLDVCPQTIHEWKRTGKLSYHKLGNRTYIKEPDLMAALQHHQRTVKKPSHR